MKREKNKKVLEINVMKNQLARALADYDNLKKRTEAEKELWMKFSAERVLIKLISVLDNFESAQKHINDQGLSIAILEFRKIFDEEGLEEVMPKAGDKFDQNMHEVVETLPGGVKNTIAEVVLSGWRFKGDKVIRYAKVKVYKS